MALRRGCPHAGGGQRLVLVAALGPPAIYLAQGLVAQSFEPLARFALVPGALLLPLAAAAVPPDRARAFRVGALAAAAAFSVAVWLVATAGRERIWVGAESLGALTRLDGEDRAVAAYLRRIRPPNAPVMIEPSAFADIGIAHAAGIPWTQYGHADRDPHRARHRTRQPAVDGRRSDGRLRPSGRLAVDPPGLAGGRYALRPLGGRRTRPPAITGRRRDIRAPWASS